MNLSLALLLAATAFAGGADRPNIVVILADDMGADSVHALHPGNGLPTPRLDRLFEQGMRFCDAHSGSAVCSPTRYGLLTGRYSWRTRLKRGIVSQWGPPLIDEARLTLADLCRDAGYHTACVGKWHLGWTWFNAEGAPTRKPAQIDWTRPLVGPLAQGFDHYIGDDVPNWPPYVWIEDGRCRGVPSVQQKAIPGNGISAGISMPQWDFEAVLPEITRRAAAYIEERAKQEQPFFLYFSMTSPHTPISPSDEFRGKSGVSVYADFLLETDWAVGEVLDALERSGVADDTLLIFTADNGTSPKADFKNLESKDVKIREHWRGHKADVFEGGHRVPFLVRRPGQVEAGARCDEPICLTDIFATVAEVLGRELPADAGEDSWSLGPLLQGARPPAWSERLVVNHSSNGSFALRHGKWKAVFCPGSGGWSNPKGKIARDTLPPVQLYDLDADPGETTNLQAEHPEQLEAMRTALRKTVESGRSTPGAPQPVAPRHWKSLPWAADG